METRYPGICGNKEEDVSDICHSHLPGVPPLGIPPLTVSFVPPSLIQAANSVSSTSKKPEVDTHSLTTSEIEEKYGKDKLTIKTTSPSNLYRYDRKIQV